VSKWLTCGYMLPTTSLSLLVRYSPLPLVCLGFVILVSSTIVKSLGCPS